MATVLLLRFPGRRYHATPWGAHVNEGRVEWPPSPWRLLRALLATGFTKLDWPKEGPPEVGRRLVERLAAALPSYALPKASLAHSRHYVDAAGKKPLILDTWAQIDEDELAVVWPVDLVEDERALLGALAAALGHLGRAESWVEARLSDAVPPVTCAPDTGGIPGPGWVATRVLCAEPAPVYAAWRQAQTAPLVAAHAPAGQKVTAAARKKLDKALAPYPRDLIAALCADTGDLQAYGWSAAPGSREVVYWRRSNALTTSPVPTWRTPKSTPVPLALLALSTASRGTSALPPLQRVWPQGRLLHRALASVVGHELDADPALALTLLGRQDGAKASHDHRHAHLLHVDLGGTGRLDHALVWAPMGLDGAAVEALRRVRRTWMKGGAGELQVALVAHGDAETLVAMAPPVGDALRPLLGPGGARSWRSRTPYVAPRLLKKRGRDSLEGQVLAECARRGLPAPASIRVGAPGSPEVVALRHHVLHDAAGGPPWPHRFALELDFAVPVPGPLALGYGAHCGLGLFEVVG